MLINQEKYAQFFTKKEQAEEMVGLIQNTGKVLEPSCGNGAIYKLLPKNSVGIEIDELIAPKDALIIDFFDYKDTDFDTIIGNPPYLAYKDISIETKNKLPKILDERSNLYLFFIWECINKLKNGGELIFLVPRDFIKATSAIPLNKRLYYEGGFTYWHEYGDEQIFNNASPNVVIFRWVKGAEHGIPISISNGIISFVDNKNKTRIGDIFTVMVGGASGANNIFINQAGNIDLVVSDTKKTGLTKKAFYVEHPNEYLIQYKNELLNRKIKTFDDTNWWKWGREIRYIPNNKIYVNCKTRDSQPFFTNESGWFDGSLLALVPKDQSLDLNFLIDKLNKNNWNEQGFVVGGRLIFSQNSLSNAYIDL